MAPRWLTGVAATGLAALLALSCGGQEQDEDDGGPGPFHDETADRDPDDPTLPQPQRCEPAEQVAAQVAEPTLRMTLPGSWDENWFASPALVDVDGDGKRDIVAARHSVIDVWRHDGAPLWKTAFPENASSSGEHGSSRMYASAVVADMDGDGDAEIAVGSDADGQHGKNVAVYDHTGELLDGWPITFGDSEVRSIAGADIDGDGVVEVLVNKTNQGPATAVYELDGTFHPGWPQVDGSCDPPEPAEACWDFGGYNQNIGAGDVDGDGVMDVISSYDAIGFGVFGGDGAPFPTHESFTDRVITAVEAYHELELAQQGWGSGDRSEFTYSPPVLADVDGDGDLEYVLAGDHEHSDDTTNQGVTVWVLNHDMTRPAGWDPPKDTGAPLASDDLGANIVRLAPAPAVANLDGQPGLEIVVPAYDGNLYAYGPDGTVRWTYAFAGGGAAYTGASEALIVDLDGDASPEILFTTYTSGDFGMPEAPAHLVVLSATGEELHRVELFARGSMAAPSVADLDGDGQLELVISLKDSVGSGEGGVQIWDLPGARDNCVLWATGRGHPLRWGYVLPG